MTNNAPTTCEIVSLTPSRADPSLQHDKNLPQTPCRQFYISHLHNQPWIQGNYSDLLMSLSAVYSELRGDVAAGLVEEAEEEDYRYSTTKYWVRMSDVSAVKHHILQHLPVYQYSDVSLGAGRGEGEGLHLWRFLLISAAFCPVEPSNSYIWTAMRHMGPSA